MDLEKPSSVAQLQEEKKKIKEEEKPEEPERILFECSSCRMSEYVDYYGKTPPFTKNIEFFYDFYVMKDPFSAPPLKHGTRSFTEYFIVLGSHCAMCQSIYCKDCSIFYKRTFCFTCAESEIKEFPLEIQSKIRKESIAIKKSLEK